MFSLFLLVQLLVVSVIGIDICPTKSLPAELKGDIVGPNQMKLHRPLNCMLTITDISPGSWIGVFKDTLNLQNVDNSPCRRQPVNLAISHSAQETKYFCDTNTPNVIYTGYSPHTASLTFHLSTEASQHIPDLQISYRVARVIYSGENVQLIEDIKEQDSIVSHSNYPQLGYSSNINSSLVLNNARLGARIHIKFYKLDLAPNCVDYLRVTGIVSRRGGNARFCSTMVDSLKEMEYIIISSMLVFNFVSTGSSEEKGFRLDYRVIARDGCVQPKLAESSFKVNMSDGSYKTYSVECSEVLQFSDRAEESLRVVCYEETWWILSSCTDKCEDVDNKCFQRCNVTSNVLSQLQCVRLAGTDGPTASTVVVAVGVSVAVFLAVVVGLVIFIYLRKRFADRRNRKKTRFSAEDVLRSESDSKTIAGIPLTAGENDSTQKVDDGEYSKLNAPISRPSDVHYSQPVNAANVTLESDSPGHETYYLAAPVDSRSYVAPSNPYEMPVAVTADDPSKCAGRSTLMQISPGNDSKRSPGSLKGATNGVQRVRVSPVVRFHKHGSPKAKDNDHTG